MSKSIISNVRKCYKCGTTYDLHKHHIFGGGRRKQSEKYGCWCYLCGKHHNLSNAGVHFYKPFDLQLKIECEHKLIYSYGWSIDRFIYTFGRNYFEGEYPGDY